MTKMNITRRSRMIFQYISWFEHQLLKCEVQVWILFKGEVFTHYQATSLKWFTKAMGCKMRIS